MNQTRNAVFATLTNHDEAVKHSAEYKLGLIAGAWCTENDTDEVERVNEKLREELAETQAAAKRREEEFKRHTDWLIEVNAEMVRQADAILAREVELKNVVVALMALSNPAYRFGEKITVKIPSVNLVMAQGQRLTEESFDLRTASHVFSAE